MLVIGAGGLATQLFDDLVFLEKRDVSFWSEVETPYTFIDETFGILKTDKEVKFFFENVSKDFVLCVSALNGNRRKLAKRFSDLGGNLSSFISPKSFISTHATVFGPGTTILSHAIFEPGCKVGEGTLINKTANAGHGCIIGEYCELAPGVMLMGNVEVGDDTFIGPGVIVQPKVKIGKNCMISSGCVIRKDVPDFSLVVTEPVRIINKKIS